MTTVKTAIINVICQPGYDAESMPFEETRAIAQQQFGSAHTVNEPYVSLGGQQVRFDVITAEPEAVKALVAASPRYQLR
jgi:hypothetical protein